MRRSKANKFRLKAELALTHDPEARREAKAEGLAVGKRVRYDFEGLGRYGTVKEVHLKSVVVQQTSGNLLKSGPVWVSEFEVPFECIKEVLGDGDPIVKQTPKLRSPLPPPPPREGGYEECDLGGKRGCEGKPVKVYSVRKVDLEIGQLGPSRLVAVCRSHDEPYVDAKCKLNHDHSVKKVGERLQNSCNCTEPAHFPLLWQLGVVFEEYAIPHEKDETDPQRISEAFENCWCGKEYGHKGFHRKKEEEDDG